MRIAVLTPLPPVRSGIASYCELFLPHLARKAEVVAVVEQELWKPPEGVEVIPFRGFDRRGFDAVMGQLGNNLYHEFIYDEAMREPLHAVIHDFVLHHLLIEKTIARGDAEAYDSALRDNHGSAAAKLARAHSLGFHAEIGNFLYPASTTLARRSRSVIVHNRWAGERLREQGVETPIVVVGHPYDESSPLPSAEDRERLRARAGVAPGERLIGMFGFVTQSKRPASVLEAFAAARRTDERLKLIVVGAAAHNVDLEAIASRFSLPPGSWQSTGWVADDEFDPWIAAVDRVVNLRYPSAGEMSGPLIHAFRIGRPVAVSGVAQFAEIPAPAVVHVPPMKGEIETLVSFMTAELPLEEIAIAQRAWLERHAALASVVEGYLRAIDGGNDLPASAPLAPSALPLLSFLRVERLEWARSAPGLWRVRVAVRVDGPLSLRNPAYGEPAVGFVLKAFTARGVVADAWLLPEGDLGQGDLFEREVEMAAEGENLRFTLEPAVANI